MRSSSIWRKIWGCLPYHQGFDDLQLYKLFQSMVTLLGGHHPSDMRKGTDTVLKKMDGLQKFKAFSSAFFSYTRIKLELLLLFYSLHKMLIWMHVKPNTRSFQWQTMYNCGNFKISSCGYFEISKKHVCLSFVLFSCLSSIFQKFPK